MKFLVVIEKARRGYSAYSPDIQGCVATGRTRAETERRMRGALAFHVKAMKVEGLAIPRPRDSYALVDVPT